MAAGLAACGGTTEPTPSVVASVQVTPGADTLEALGQTQQLSAVAKDAAGNTIPGKTFTWQSSASGVASVDASSGLVTAVANGAATITASVDGKSGQAAVAVLQQVATVTVSPDTGLLAAIGATRQFSAAAKDANNSAVTGVKFIWLSSNHAVATVDTAGLATSVGPGTVTITAAARGVPGTAQLRVTQTAAKLAFSVQPTSTVLDQAISPVVQVEIQDAAGTRVAGARNPVSLAIGANPGNGGQLAGSLTANAVDGIASFSGLMITNWGQGYTLVATAAGLTQATSAGFDVTLGLVQLEDGANCGITRTGRAFCWGDNLYGKIGDGTTANRNVPVPVAGGLSFAMTSTSLWIPDGAHTCGTTTGGASYCWGGLGVGDGTSNLYTVPWPTGFSASFTDIAAGALHTCAVASDHSAYCWGDNQFGELGNNQTSGSQALSPVQVVGGLSLQNVSAGNFDTCGITTGGTLYCWGLNNWGQLGIGSTKSDSVPRQVGVNFASVTNGMFATCGLANGGAAYCWGMNDSGQVGNGSHSGLPSDSVPVAVSGSLTFATLSAGGRHACGVTAAGVAYCWGTNGNGRLGDGSTTERDAPVPVSGGLSFAAVKAGRAHSCGITTSGAVYCWGRNNVGQLGNGTYTDSSVPVRVKGT